MKKGFPLTAVCFALLALFIYLFAVRQHVPKRTASLSEEDYKLPPHYTYKYIINQPHACTNKNDLLVVFMVPVAPLQFAERAAVRKTWGSRRVDTLTLFFLGTYAKGGAHGPEIQARIREESQNHNDIIQLNFIDSYKNLTLKTLAMMSWLHAHCPQTRYGMKADADVFVNVFYLRDYLRRCPLKDFITGSVISDGKPRRGSGSKWQLTAEQFPEDNLPPYVSGAGYVFSQDLAGGISWASRLVSFIPLEDVYVGLCLRVLDVRPQYAYSLPFMRSLFEVRSLEYERCSFAGLLLVNGFTPLELVAAWRDFSREYATC